MNLKQQIIETLEDSGCNQETIKKFIVAFQNKELENQRYLLMNHKNRLREAVYAKQRQIDCLDYLVFKLHLNE